MLEIQSFFDAYILILAPLYATFYLLGWFLIIYSISTIWSPLKSLVTIEIPSFKLL